MRSLARGLAPHFETLAALPLYATRPLLENIERATGSEFVCIGETLQIEFDLVHITACIVVVRDGDRLRATLRMEYCNYVRMAATEPEDPTGWGIV